MKRTLGFYISMWCLIIAVSCSSPTPSEMFGTWELAENTTGASDPSAWLALHSDGTFETESMPWELFGRKDRLEGLAIGGSGTWKMEASSIQLDFLVIEPPEAASLAPFTAMMSTKQLFGDRQLYFFRGDPDLADFVIFKKKL